MPKFFTCLSTEYPSYGFPFTDDQILNDDLPPLIEVPEFGSHEGCKLSENTIYAAYVIQKDDGRWDVDGSIFGIIADLRSRAPDLSSYEATYMTDIDFFLVTHNGIAVPINCEYYENFRNIGPFYYLSPQRFGFESYPIRNKKPVEWRKSLMDGEELYEDT